MTRDPHERAAGSPESTVPTGHPNDPYTPTEDADETIDECAVRVTAMYMAILEGREMAIIDKADLWDLLKRIEKPIRSTFLTLGEDYRREWMRRLRP